MKELTRITPSNVMIDLETMGTTPCAAIVSIGAVLFDPRCNVVTNKTFYEELHWESQGRAITDNTKEWWLSQSERAKEALNGIVELDAALVALSEWLPKNCVVWGNGPTFDISILEDAYRQYGIDIPWKFWNIRDCRTIRYMFECKRGGIGAPTNNVEHIAVDDAIAQAKYICKMWRDLLNG